MRHQKLPATARGVVLAEVDLNDEFRLRVLPMADVASVGAAGMLWLARPDGWEAQLTEVLQAPITKDDHRLVQAQKLLRDTRSELALAKAEVLTLQRRLAEAAATSTKAERTRAGMQDEIAGLRGKLDRSESDRASLLRELRDLSDEIERRDDAEEDSDDGSWQALFVPEPDTVDFARLSIDLTAAEDANMALAEAIAVVRRSLYRPDPARPAMASVVQLVPPLREPTRLPNKTHRKKRHRLRLPGGVMAESAEAGKFFLARTDIVCVIDGYNVAKLAFPRATLALQREHLLDLADEVQARHGTNMLVMFDGADIGPTKAHRHRVGVQFSPAGVTADDMIVSWLTSEPLDQAVLVVTSDNAVRETCDFLGAHLIRSAEFVLAAGRRT